MKEIIAIVVVGAGLLIMGLVTVGIVLALLSGAGLVVTAFI